MQVVAYPVLALGQAMLFIMQVLKFLMQFYL